MPSLETSLILKRHCCSTPHDVTQLKDTRGLISAPCGAWQDVPGSGKTPWSICTARTERRQKCHCNNTKQGGPQYSLCFFASCSITRHASNTPAHRATVLSTLVLQGPSLLGKKTVICQLHSRAARLDAPYSVTFRSAVSCTTAVG